MLILKPKGKLEEFANDRRRDGKINMENRG
jgi:hypothetical protein